MTDPAPALADVSHAATRFATLFRPDAGWQRFVAATGAGPDLALAAHRAELLRCLNAWGCRMRYPRPGEPDLFDESVAHWWTLWRDRLPATSIGRLSDVEIAGAGQCFEALSAAPTSRGTRLSSVGPTAAAKALHALRPEALMPWDAAIATRLHGERNGAAFARHQDLGRRWTRALMTEAGVDEAALPGILGRPQLPLAKILDQYCYLTVTRADDSVSAVPVPVDR